MISHLLITELDHLADSVIWFLYCKWGFLKISLSLLYFLTGNYYVQPTLKPWRFMLLFFQSRIYTLIIWNYSTREICPLSPTFVFSQSFVSVCNNGYLLYTLRYNLFCFITQIVPGLAIGSSFSWLCVPLMYPHQFRWVLFHFVCFLVLPYFLVSKDSIGS